MGRFKRTDTSVNGVKKTRVPRPKPTKRWGLREVPPETDEQKLRRLRACALIMARRFGIREWHRSYLTPIEIAGVEQERGEVL